MKKIKTFFKILLLLAFSSYVAYMCYQKLPFVWKIWGVITAFFANLTFWLHLLCGSIRADINKLTKEFEKYAYRETSIPIWFRSYWHSENPKYGMDRLEKKITEYRYDKDVDCFDYCCPSRNWGSKNFWNYEKAREDYNQTGSVYRFFGIMLSLSLLFSAVYSCVLFFKGEQIIVNGSIEERNLYITVFFMILGIISGFILRHINKEVYLLTPAKIMSKEEKNFLEIGASKYKKDAIYKDFDKSNPYWYMEAYENVYKPTVKKNKQKEILLSKIKFITAKKLLQEHEVKYYEEKQRYLEEQKLKEEEKRKREAELEAELERQRNQPERKARDFCIEVWHKLSPLYKKEIALKVVKQKLDKEGVKYTDIEQEFIKFCESLPNQDHTMIAYTLWNMQTSEDLEKANKDIDQLITDGILISTGINRVKDLIKYMPSGYKEWWEGQLKMLFDRWFAKQEYSKSDYDKVFQRFFSFDSNRYFLDMKYGYDARIYEIYLLYTDEECVEFEYICKKERMRQEDIKRWQAQQKAEAERKRQEEEKKKEAANNWYYPSASEIAAAQQQLDAKQAEERELDLRHRYPGIEKFSGTPNDRVQMWYIEREQNGIYG